MVPQPQPQPQPEPELVRSVVGKAVKKVVLGWGDKGPEKREMELLRALVWAVVYSCFYSGGLELGE